MVSNPSYKTLLALVFMALVMPNLFSQDIKTKRIQFEKGRSGATVEASITGSEIIDYLINVQEGQVLNVSMATDNSANYFNIMEPEEEYVAIFNGSLNENMFEGILKKSGDYRIRVYLMRSAARRNEKANYRLEVNVSPLEPKVQQKDATVGSTNFNATGKIPCSSGESEPNENCDFGVIREGNGSGKVIITRMDGVTRTIYFKNGEATGYSGTDEDQEKFEASKNADLYIINIGNERYQIPEAVIYGG